MARCKPGDVCLVVRGPSTGLCVTIIDYATLKEVMDFALYVKGDDMVPSCPDEQFWLLDKEVVWAGIGCEDESYPYECDSYLMPIGSKDKDKQTDRELEKTHHEM